MSHPELEQMSYWQEYTGLHKQQGRYYTLVSPKTTKDFPVKIKMEFTDEVVLLLKAVTCKA